MAASGCSCKGGWLKMCAKCADTKPYMEFRLGVNGGYFFGSGYPIESERGKPVHPAPSNKEDTDDS